MQNQIEIASQYLQRLLAGVPSRPPARDMFNGYHTALQSIFDVAQAGGPAAARRAFDALRRADPALAALDVVQPDYYPGDPDLDNAAAAALNTFEYTEAGQSEAFAWLYAEKMRYVPGIGWYIWDGVRWVADGNLARVQFAITAARTRRRALRMTPPPSGEGDDVQQQLKQRERARAWLLAAESKSKSENVLHLAGTLPGMITDNNELDRDPHLLGVNNGMVDLRTGQLLPADRARMITKSTGLPFFAEAQAPRWEQFITEITAGDSELAAYLQRAIGYSLTADGSEQCFFLAHGTGANGKSTLFNMLAKVAGEYSANTPFNTFEDGKQSNTNQELIALAGKRVVMSSETSEGTKLNEARIKAITGRDPVSGRYLYSRTGITITPVFKLWLAVNHKPIIRSGGHGLWRRVRLIPFNARFTDDQKDKHLEEKLTAELPGILAWSVRGTVAWYRQGLGEPPAVTEATKAYEADSDILGQFLEACAVQGDGFQAQSSLLYSDYEAWAEANGIRPLSSVAFARAMQERGYTKKRTAPGTMWQGIGLLSEVHSND